jgi:hypothetical protein
MQHGEGLRPQGDFAAIEQETPAIQIQNIAAEAQPLRW